MSRKAKLYTPVFYRESKIICVEKSSANSESQSRPVLRHTGKKSSAFRSQVPTVRNADDFFTYYLLKASVKINSVPTPTVLTTSIVSLCACKISLVIESPRPEPFLSRPRDASDL